jgi:hypothetical protein
VDTVVPAAHPACADDADDADAACTPPIVAAVSTMAAATAAKRDVRSLRKTDPTFRLAVIEFFTSSLPGPHLPLSSTAMMARATALLRRSNEGNGADLAGYWPAPTVAARAHSRARSGLPGWPGR